MAGSNMAGQGEELTNIKLHDTRCNTMTAEKRWKGDVSRENMYLHIINKSVNT